MKYKSAGTTAACPACAGLATAGKEAPIRGAMASP
jgi:hypothetical protein